MKILLAFNITIMFLILACTCITNLNIDQKYNMVTENINSLQIKSKMK